MHAEEFLYPVAAYRDHEGFTKVLVLYQKSLEHIELWQWDLATQRAHKALLSSFTPAGVRMLPDMTGFSFVDSGRIRIKEFCKRSPKAIDIYEPVYDIGVVEWADNETGYFSAKMRDHYSIFSVTRDGDTCCLVTKPGADCMYPKKIGEYLFYIERTAVQTDDLFAPGIDTKEHYTYRIMKTAYQGDATAKVPPLCVANFDTRPIVFLTMVSAREGFVIEHATVIDKHDPVVIFLYHRLLCDEAGMWSHRYLFSFSVPSELLLPTSNRLYESLLPLLPRPIHNYIYYVDLVPGNDGSACLFPCRYSLHTFMKEVIPHSGIHHSFAPFFVDSLLLYGGTLISASAPYMTLDHDGQVCFQFPVLDFPTDSD